MRELEKTQATKIVSSSIKKARAQKLVYDKLWFDLPFSSLGTDSS